MGSHSPDEFSPSLPALFGLSTLLAGKPQRRRIFRQSGLRNRVWMSRVRAVVHTTFDVSGLILWV
jgi:hypothetical protein